MEVAPASSEFSRSSLTTEAGRSTTSPAAILFATLSERTRILPTQLLQHDAAFVEQFTRALEQIQQVALIADRLGHQVRLGLHKRVLGIEHEEQRNHAELVALLVRLDALLGEITGDLCDP